MLQTAYLMRHATPDWTRTDIRYDIPPGPPLTDVGLAEARSAAQFLADKGISHVFASPLERTLTTAQIIADTLNLSLQIEDQLAEWREDEDEDAVATRSRTYWDALWQGFAQEKLEQTPLPLLVSHGGPSRLLLQSLGLDPDHMEHFRAQFDHNNPMPPAGIWRIEQIPDAADWKMELVFAPVPYNVFE